MNTNRMLALGGVALALSITLVTGIQSVVADQSGVILVVNFGRVVIQLGWTRVIQVQQDEVIVHAATIETQEERDDLL